MFTSKKEQVDLSSDNTSNTFTDQGAMDPFAGQRDANNNPFSMDDQRAGDDSLNGSPTTDRRQSKEWDASKVPPSQFQKRKGSFLSTPGSRDGHVKGSDRDKAYHDKLKEKGWK